MCPGSYDRIPQSAQPPGITPITFLVTRNLVEPPLPVVNRWPEAPRAPMPKASVNKNDHGVLHQHEVGLSRQVFHIPAEPNMPRSQHSTNPVFLSCPLRANGTHMSGNFRALWLHALANGSDALQPAFASKAPIYIWDDKCGPRLAGATQYLGVRPPAGEQSP